MIDWLIELLPYQKYAGYILASYSVGLLSLLFLVAYLIKRRKNTMKQLRLKYQRETYQKNHDT